MTYEVVATAAHTDHEVVHTPRISWPGHLYWATSVRIRVRRYRRRLPTAVVCVVGCAGGSAMILPVAAFESVSARGAALLVRWWAARVFAAVRGTAEEQCAAHVLAAAGCLVDELSAIEPS